MTLIDVLTSESKRDAVIQDCCDLIDAEVGDKGGISGMAIKAGYSAVKGIKPGFVKQVVRDLLPEFAKALDPIYAEAKTKGEPVDKLFERSASRVADSLLTITDGKAERSTNKVIKGTYGKLRGMAKKNVEQAIPRLGRLIQKHAG